MKKIKRFVKEIKRVRWPSGKEGNITFILSIAFISIAALILFGVSIGLTILWKKWGVGI